MKKQRGCYSPEAVFDDVMALAKQRGLEKNPLFRSTLSTYITIMDTIAAQKERLADGGVDDLNAYARSITALTEGANKTTKVLLQILDEMGTVSESDELIDFIKGVQ